LDNGKRPTPTNTTKIKGCCKHQSSPHTPKKNKVLLEELLIIFWMMGRKKGTKTTRRKWLNTHP
jgi:hypothetical protein